MADIKLISEEAFYTFSFIWGNSQLHIVDDVHVTDQVYYKSSKLRNEDPKTGYA
jgi:hypothetical protein